MKRPVQNSAEQPDELEKKGRVGKFTRQKAFVEAFGGTEPMPHAPVVSRPGHAARGVIAAIAPPQE